jgi:hypothetical protein
MRSLQLFTFALLATAAIPARASLDLGINFTLSNSLIVCCQTLSVRNDFATGGVNGVLNGVQLSIGIFDFPVSESIQTGDLIGTIGNTLTFDGGTVGIPGGLYSRYLPGTCEADGGKLFLEFTTGRPLCGYGSLSPGVLVGDLTLTSTQTAGLYTFAGIAQFLYTPQGSLSPTTLIEGPLTGSLFSAGGLQQGFLAEFDLTFGGAGTPIPEPSTILLLGTVLVLITGRWAKSKLSR